MHFTPISYFTILTIKFQLKKKSNLRTTIGLTDLQASLIEAVSKAVTESEVVMNTVTADKLTFYSSPNIFIFNINNQLMLDLLSTKWVDYVEEPMKYQALRPQFFSMGGWGVVGWVVEGWWVV